MFRALRHLVFIWCPLKGSRRCLDYLWRFQGILGMTNEGGNDSTSSKPHLKKKTADKVKNWKSSKSRLKKDLFGLVTGLLTMLNTLLHPQRRLLASSDNNKHRSRFWGCGCHFEIVLSTFWLCALSGRLGQVGSWEVTWWNIWARVGGGGGHATPREQFAGTVTYVSSGFRCIDKDVFFTWGMCPRGYRPCRGDTVKVTAIESQQECY